jgi:hypothetical protein
MSTSFPAGLDSIAKPDATTLMSDSGFEGDVLLGNIIDALLATQTKVGITNSLLTTSLDYMLKNGSNPGHTHTLANGATDVTSTATELNLLHSITPGTVAASKFVLVDASKNIDFGTGSITATTGTLTNVTMQNTGNLTLGNTTTVKGRWDGWVLSSDTWVYASATTFTILGVDRTTLFSTGDKIRLKQGGGYKYFYVIAIAFATDTTITITGGVDYTLTNAAITDNYYSKVNANGFPDWFGNSAGSASTTGLTGWSAVTEHIEKFKLNGRQVIYSGCIIGTSNSVTTQVNLPIQAATITNMEWGNALTLAVDNGAAKAGATKIAFASAATVASFFTDMSGAAWTNANGKTVEWTVTYQI